jgi:hypothetical protein
MHYMVVLSEAVLYSPGPRKLKPHAKHNGAEQLYIMRSLTEELQTE